MRQNQESAGETSGHKASSGVSLSVGLSRVETVANTLEGYADRAVFRGFSQGPSPKGKAEFKILWHRDRFFDLVLDTKKNTIRFPLLLPGVPTDSAMYSQFRKFLALYHSEGVPEHRRIDGLRASIRCQNRGGDISLTLKIVDGDYDYGTRKLIHFVHEVFLVFLADGRYSEYMVENFNVDPDGP